MTVTDPLIDKIELHTARLCLRSLHSDDASAIASYRGLPDVARYQSWESFSIDDASRMIAEQQSEVPGTPGAWLQLAITLKVTGTLMGDCGINFSMDDDRQVAVGITLSPGYQHQGLAAEAMDGILRYLFDVLGKHRVSTVVDVDNSASLRLMRRVGFRQEAHHIENVWFKGGWGSDIVFAMLDREWKERRA